MNRVSMILALAAAAVLWTNRAVSAEELNLPVWLDRPTVKLLAVEFYSTTCKPCMQAMPRWEALTAKYRKQGLRVVVVSTLDADGCAKGLGWSPDETVCDLDGRIADSFGLSGQLPAAFLWSWQGKLLVQKGHVDEVEKTVAQYFAGAPRLALRGGQGVGPQELAALRDKLTESGKLTLVAGDAERKLLQEAKRRQQEADYDEKLRCEPGREVPANSVLAATKVVQGKTAWFFLALLDLESGCQAQAVSVPWKSDSRAMAAEAVGLLLGRFKAGGLQLPGKPVPTQDPPKSVLPNAAPVDRFGTPQQFVQDGYHLLNRLRRVAGSPLELRAALQREAKKLIDFELLAQSLLDLHWQTLDNDQRTAFVAALQGHFLQVPVERIRNEPVQLEYGGTRLQGGVTAQVLTNITVGSSTTEAEFALQRGNAGWIVVDVAVDGTSFVKTYQRAIRRVLEKEGWTGLMRRMRKIGRGLNRP
jgi:ABC-type transporter MlaC component/thiol-disulfide isomerase/thioredoxin